MKGFVIGKGEIGLGGAIGDGDFLRKRLGELGMPSFHRVSAIGEGTVHVISAIRSGNGAVDAFMNVDPGFHPAVYVTLQTVDAGDGEDFGVGIALRSLGEIREVLSFVAAAELMTGDANVVEGEIAVVKADGLPGLHGKRVGNKLAVSLIDQRCLHRQIGGTWAAFDGDDDIGESAVGGDFPVRIDDFAMSGAKGISADIDDFAQRSRVNASEGDFAFNAGFFSDFDSRSQRSLWKLRTTIGDFAATGAGEAQNDSQGGQ